MNAPHKAHCPGGAGQSAERNTHPHIVAGDVEQRKSLATIVARFALRGHVVHTTTEGGFLVCRHGYVRHCKDIPALEAFGKQVGAL